MKISKESKITGFVVEPSNIKELAENVYKEYKSDNESDHKHISFILEGVNGTRYESENIEESLIF